MGIIFKILKGIIVFIIVFAVILVLGRNVIVKHGLPIGFKAVTGLQMRMDFVSIGLRSTLLDIQGLKIYNPEGYDDPLMLDVPLIYVDYNLPAILGGVLHLHDVKFHLEEAMLIKQKDGTSNIDAFKKVAARVQAGRGAEQAPKTETAKAPMPVRIDVLELKIGQVVVKDYSKGAKPVVDTYRINIDKRFENITDIKAFVSTFLMQNMDKLIINAIGTVGLDKVGGLLGDSIRGAGNLGLDAARMGLETGKGTVEGAANVLKGTVGEATNVLKDTADGVKNILTLPFGSKSE